VKVTLILFFDYEYVLESQTVNQIIIEVVKRLRLAVCRKRPQKRESRV
jgi:hypothetical protein